MDKKIVRINGYNVSKALGYVYDGCHKFYIIEDSGDLFEAKNFHGGNVVVHPLTSAMFFEFIKSCPLRFIETWNLANEIIPQGVESEDGIEFEYEDGTIAVYYPDADYE